MAHGQILKAINNECSAAKSVARNMPVRRQYKKGEVPMDPKSLEGLGFPSVVVYANSKVVDTATGQVLHEAWDTSRPLSVKLTDSSGKTKWFSVDKLVKFCFNAPWNCGIPCKKLDCIGCSRYYATVTGRIFGTRNMDYLVPRITPDGYEAVALYADNGDYIPWRVNRIIATAFIPNPEKKDTVDHIDGNRRNNRVENLRWMWMWENSLHRSETRFGITEEVVRNICQMLQDGVTPTNAAKRAGVPYHIVKGIRSGSYYNIAKDYDFELVNNPRRLPAEARGEKTTPHWKLRRVHVLPEMVSFL